MVDLSAPKYERNTYAEMRPHAVIIISVILHILALVGIPFISRFLIKEKVTERPPTFELVTIAPPLPPPPSRQMPVEQPPEPPPPEVVPETPPPPPPPPTPTPTPTPPPPRPTPPTKAQPVEEPPPPKPEPPKETQVVRDVPKVDENIDDLEALFAAKQPTSQIATDVPMTTALQVYLNDVRGRIERKWREETNNNRSSMPNNDRAVEFAFIINRDGSVSPGSIRITKSSNHGILDNLATRSVTLTSPYRPLPAGFSGDKLNITYTLRYERR